MAIPISAPKTVVFPSSLDQVVRASTPNSEFHAGGTDLVDRLQLGHTHVETLVHLRNFDASRGITQKDGVVTLMAGTTLADVASADSVKQFAPVLAAAARHTATPQIRHRATVGGALFQRPRCPYFRNAEMNCAKTSGGICLAKEGDHHAHAIFQNAVCAAPHPSTIATALLALDATASVAAKTADGQVKTSQVAFADLFAIDLADATVENTLATGAFVESISVPVRASHRGQMYRRASARRLADWADVEVAIVLDVVGGVVADARVVLGAVARTPLRATGAESVLKGKPLVTRTIQKAAAAATTGATPLDQNKWKVDMTQALVFDALNAIHDGHDPIDAGLGGTR